MSSPSQFKNVRYEGSQSRLRSPSSSPSSLPLPFPLPTFGSGSGPGSGCGLQSDRVNSGMQQSTDSSIRGPRSPFAINNSINNDPVCGRNAEPKQSAEEESSKTGAGFHEDYDVPMKISLSTFILMLMNIDRNNEWMDDKNCESDYTDIGTNESQVRRSRSQSGSPQNDIDLKEDSDMYETYRQQGRGFENIDTSSFSHYYMNNQIYGANAMRENRDNRSRDRVSQSHRLRERKLKVRNSKSNSPLFLTTNTETDTTRDNTRTPPVVDTFERFLVVNKEGVVSPRHASKSLFLNNKNGPISEQSASSRFIFGQVIRDSSTFSSTPTATTACGSATATPSKESPSRSQGHSVRSKPDLVTCIDGGPSHPSQFPPIGPYDQLFSDIYNIDSNRHLLTRSPRSSSCPLTESTAANTFLSALAFLPSSPSTDSCAVQMRNEKHGRQKGVDSFYYPRKSVSTRSSDTIIPTKHNANMIMEDQIKRIVTPTSHSSDIHITNLSGGRGISKASMRDGGFSSRENLKDALHSYMQDVTDKLNDVFSFVEDNENETPLKRNRSEDSRDFKDVKSSSASTSDSVSDDVLNDIMTNLMNNVARYNVKVVMTPGQGSILENKKDDNLLISETATTPTSCLSDGYINLNNYFVNIIHNCFADLDTNEDGYLRAIDFNEKHDNNECDRDDQSIDEEGNEDDDEEGEEKSGGQGKNDLLISEIEKIRIKDLGFLYTENLKVMRAAHSYGAGRTEMKKMKEGSMVRYRLTFMGTIFAYSFQFFSRFLCYVFGSELMLLLYSTMINRNQTYKSLIRITN